ncbi:DUF3667 domain-containing protein [Solimonas terrae]|uniref:DUF3667 domain-containing protein n=1 Tax=Solimonas terrae TaxID=1396819 RepID=A0A6M2BTT8_9GAMM|nr:DUF3667 domain-containing protein [Solimonas terrae]NGY05631.1 DUF3667 domain-containing protein [Solimonas terrae]
MPGPLSAQQDAATAEVRCPNCGTGYADLYCPHCAQPAGTGMPTVRGFAAEFADKLFALQGRLPLTLKVLLARPGGLTADYLEGRRARYLKPLNLYVAVSVMFFLMLGLVPGIRIHLGWTLEIVTLAAPQSGITADTGVAMIDARVAEFGTLPDERQQHVLRDGMLHNAPRAMFVLVPLFAALLAALYRQRYYGEHLLFALHFHSFAFLILLAGLVPWPQPLHDIVNDLINVGLAGYLYLALRRVYGSSRLGTALRVAIVAAVYAFALAAAAVGVVVGLRT